MCVCVCVHVCVCVCMHVCVCLCVSVYVYIHLSNCGVIHPVNTRSACGCAALMPAVVSDSGRMDGVSLG